MSSRAKKPALSAAEGRDLLFFYATKAAGTGPAGTMRTEEHRVAGAGKDEECAWNPVDSLPVSTMTPLRSR